MLWQVKQQKAMGWGCGVELCMLTWALPSHGPEGDAGSETRCPSAAARADAELETLDQQSSVQISKPQQAVQVSS